MIAYTTTLVLLQLMVSSTFGQAYKMALQHVPTSVNTSKLPSANNIGNQHRQKAYALEQMNNGTTYYQHHEQPSASAPSNSSSNSVSPPSDINKDSSGNASIISTIISHFHLILPNTIQNQNVKNTSTPTDTAIKPNAINQKPVNQSSSPLSSTLSPKGPRLVNVTNQTTVTSSAPASVLPDGPRLIESTPTLILNKSNPQTTMQPIILPTSNVSNANITRIQSQYNSSQSTTIPLSTTPTTTTTTAAAIKSIHSSHEHGSSAANHQGQPNHHLLFIFPIIVQLLVKFLLK